MTLLEVLDGVEIITQSGNPELTGVEYDSRKAKPGSVFIALPGQKADGASFAPQAVASGHSGVMMRASRKLNVSFTAAL